MVRAAGEGSFTKGGIMSSVTIAAAARRWLSRARLSRRDSSLAIKGTDKMTEAEETNLSEERERAAADVDEGTSPWQDGGGPLKLMAKLIPG